MRVIVVLNQFICSFIKMKIACAGTVEVNFKFVSKEKKINQNIAIH